MRQGFKQKRKRKLVIFERKVLRRIFGQKKNEEANEYELRTNGDFNNLIRHSSSNKAQKNRVDRTCLRQNFSAPLKENY